MLETKQDGLPAMRGLSIVSMNMRSHGAHSMMFLSASHSKWHENRAGLQFYRARWTRGSDWTNTSNTFSGKVTCLKCLHTKSKNNKFSKWQKNAFNNNNNNSNIQL